MSASDQMRNMISQLMGTARDGDTAKQGAIKFDDLRVCKSFLLKCCPNDILSSTRMDMGECTKIHDIALRADYEIASQKHDYRYDIEAYNKLNLFIADLDKKVEMAKIRLKETQAELSEEANEKADAIHKLGEQIGVTLSKAEQIGAEGHVDESLKMLEEVEVLKKQKHEAEMEYRNVLPASTYQQQKLRVCEICSAYLGIHDNDRRLADHFGGKLHMGFIEIRAKLEDLKKVVEKKREMRDLADQRALKEVEEKNAPVQRSERSERDDSRRRSRSRSRERNSRKSSSRRSRSRSREAKRRSHSDRRSRSRSGSHKSSKSRRHRRSRSRSKSNSKSQSRRRSPDRRSKEKRSDSRSERRSEGRSRDGDDKNRSHKDDVKAGAE